MNQQLSESYGRGHHVNKYTIALSVRMKNNERYHYLRVFQRYIGFFCVCCILLSSFSIYAQRYFEVSGEIELISYITKNANGVPSRRTYPFTCIVGTNEWRIDTEFLLNGKEAWYFDGTNVYHRVQQTAEFRPMTNFSRVGLPGYLPLEQVKSNITVEIIPSPGGHPLGNLGVNLPWLAFASGGYLKRANRVVPLPTTEVHQTPSAFGYVDQVEIFEDEIGLPKSLKLFTSQAQYKNSVTDDRLVLSVSVQRERANPVSEQPDGILKFRYIVEETTNFFGVILPAKFGFETHDVDQKGNRQLRNAGIGRLNFVRESSRPENVLMPDLHQTFVDYRFRADNRPVDGIIYHLTNTAIMAPTNDPVLWAKFERVMKRAPLEEATQTRRRWILGVLLIVFAVPPFLAVWRSLKTKTQKRNAE